MATYLNGVTDFIPQIQPFKPDFNFFQSALEKKQLQYEAGYEKINSVYSQLLNSPLIRQGNKDRRDNLFNDIDNEIKRLSGVDLSLAENVQQAGKLFTPLINDPYFRKDLAFTRQYQGQLSRADNMRRSPNPKSDERYWEEGVSALHYMAEDFSKSTDDDSLRFAAPKYTPFINTAEKLFKFAKDNAINPTNVEFKGGYIWTYKNGAPAIPTLQNVFSTILNGDSRVKDMFQTQAYINRKNYIQTGASNFGGDVNQAEQAYLKDKVGQINQYYREANRDDEQKYSTADTKKKVIEKRIFDRGVDPNLEKDLIDLYQNTSTDVSTQLSVLDKNKSVLTSTDFMSYDPSNLEAMRQRVDGAMATFLMDGMSSKIATDYAMSKFDVEVKEDPYVKMKVQHAYDMSKLKQEFDYDVVLKLMDIAKAKNEVEGEAIPGTTPDEFFNSGVISTNPGSGGVVSEDQNIMARNAGSQQQAGNVVVASGRDSAMNFLNYQNQIIASPNSTPEQKNYAEQTIKNVLGEYQVTEEEGGYTFEKDAPTDWGRVGKGVMSTALAPIASMFGGFIGQAAVDAYGYNEVYQGLAGNEKVEVKGKTTKSSGYAVKQPDGTYALADLSTIPGHDIYGADNYMGNVQKKIAEYAKQNLTLSRDANATALKEIIDTNQQRIDVKQNIITALSETSKANNAKINTLLVKEAGVSPLAASVFFNDQKTAPRTENEFIVEYVKAAKRDRALGSPGGSALQQAAAITGRESFLNPLKGGMDEMDYVEDAQDAYEDLKESYERLAKASELGLESYTDNLSNEEGINRYFTHQATYGFDAASYNTKSFKLAMDFLKKDLIPNITSNTTTAQNGTKILSGVSGIDLTAEEYEGMNNDPKAALLLKTFLASAAMNYGGKTGENQVRPTGTFTLSAVAANDANKVAMTWDLSPEWIAKHAGTEKSPGPAWEMQQKMAEGTGTNQITFFMDADKARSAGFVSMQATDEEMLLNLTGNLRLNAHADYGGNLDIRKNADNTFSYWGVAKSMNELGQMIDQPISGTTDADINALSQYWNQTFSEFAQTNMNYKNSLVTNSPNKVYDPNAFAQP